MATPVPVDYDGLEASDPVGGPEEVPVSAVPGARPAPPSLSPFVEGALLAGLVLLFVGLDFVWIDLNQRPLMERAYFDLTSALLLARDGELPRAYPPLVHAWVGGAVEWTGGDLRTAQKALALFTVPYLLGMWAWGRQYAGALGGLVLAAAAGGAIWYASYSRVLAVEAAPAALLACALAALAASRGLRRPVPALLCGVFTGLGMLAKWLFLPFVALPWLVVGAATVRAGRTATLFLGLSAAGVAATFVLLSPLNPEPVLPGWAPGALYGGWLLLLGAAVAKRRSGDPPAGEWNRGAALAASLAVAVLICAPWYVYDFPSLRGLALGDAAELNPFRENLADYLMQIRTVGTFASVLLPLGLLIGLVQPRLRMPVATAAVALLAGVLLLSAAGPRFWPRYLLPGTPLIVFVAFAPLALAVRRLAPGAGGAVFAAVLAISLVQVGSFAWQSSAPAPRLRDGEVDLAASVHAPPPDPADYPFEEIVAALPRPLDAVTVFELSPGFMPEGTLTALARLGGERLRHERNVVVAILNSDMTVEERPDTASVLVVKPHALSDEWLLEHVPGLAGYRLVGEWASVHPEGWCAYPWEKAAIRCAQNGHRMDYRLWHREAVTGTLTTQPNLLH